MKLLIAFCFLVFDSLTRAETIQADLCVYQGTPDGIAMAVRAARGGLSVVLVNYDRGTGN